MIELSKVETKDQEVKRENANSFLRRRRANDGYEEYWSSGSFERECVEEVCDSNEFHEVYDYHDVAEPRLVISSLSNKLLT